MQKDVVEAVGIISNSGTGGGGDLVLLADGKQRNTLFKNTRDQQKVAIRKIREQKCWFVEKIIDDYSNVYDDHHDTQKYYDGF